ncbi:MAG TPA: hypothetical protein VF008_28685 [Niastella sp.]
MMKRSLSLIAFMTIYVISIGQVNTLKIADSISKEGKKLYKSEIASWYGTDIFIDRFKNEASNIGGYFSYSDKSNETCLFFSKGDNPQVLGTVNFDSTNNLEKVIVDGTKRKFSEHENDIYLIRKAALDEIEKDTSFFKTYNNTNLNLIPFVEGEEKRVYVLTGTSRANTIIIGNDYLLNFDKDNILISKKKLHANILTLKYAEEGKVNKEGSVHTHLPETGAYMTATDICTFMLYEKIAGWKQQLVISEKYMSIWNCETDRLIIVPTGR